MEKFVKLVELMVALGYAEKNARGQATAQLKKLTKVNPMFEIDEVRKNTNVLTMDETMELLKLIADSKSKYKENATILLNKGLDDSLLTEDDAWKPVKSSKKKAPSKPKKADLSEFIQAKGLQEEFDQWFKAKKIEG